MPSRLYRTIGDQWGIEGEVGFREKLKTDKAQTGDRLAVADVDGAYSCPVCGEPGELPPPDELRRLADEQGGPRIP